MGGFFLLFCLSVPSCKVGAATQPLQEAVVASGYIHA